VKLVLVRHETFGDGVLYRHLRRSDAD
jgi:hypothetical protein